MRRHGGAKKDLSTLVLATAADLWLRDSGQLAFVLPQTIFQTKGAGDGFRRFQLGDDGAPLKVLRVDDLVQVKPFAGAANWTSVLFLEKGRPTEYPVDYFVWQAIGDTDDSSGHRIERCFAEPIDVTRRQSPWIIRPAGDKRGYSSICSKSDYVAHLGANTGGANGVLWVELLNAHIV